MQPNSNAWYLEQQPPSNPTQSQTPASVKQLQHIFQKLWDILHWKTNNNSQPLGSSVAAQQAALQPKWEYTKRCWIGYCASNVSSVKLKKQGYRVCHQESRESEALFFLGFLTVKQCETEGSHHDWYWYTVSNPGQQIKQIRMMAHKMSRLMCLENKNDCIMLYLLHCMREPISVGISRKAKRVSKSFV